MLKGRYRHPGNAVIEKQFGYVGNVCAEIGALILAPGDAIRGKVFYLADYEPIEVGRFAAEIADCAGVTRPRPMPLFLLSGIARGGDLLKRVGVQHPPLTTFRLSNLLTPMLYDMGTMKSVLSQLPIEREHAISETVAWMRAQGGI